MAINDRFKDIIWCPQERTHCIVGGAGGISSWLCLLLARAGFVPVVYDFDTIEEHNIGGQFFPIRSIGKSKVLQLQESITQFTDIHIMALHEKFEQTSMSNKYMFSGFDNMQARKDMFAVWMRNLNTLSTEQRKNCIFIDGRLQAERFQIFCIKGDDSASMEEYQKTHLFDDSEVEDAACTMKQTSHTAAIIAGFMVSFFTNFLSNRIDPSSARNVPFSYDFFLPLTIEM